MVRRLNKIILSIGLIVSLLIINQLVFKPSAQAENDCSEVIVKSYYATNNAFGGKLKVGRSIAVDRSIIPAGSVVKIKFDNQSIDDQYGGVYLAEDSDKKTTSCNIKLLIPFNKVSQWSDSTAKLEVIEEGKNNAASVNAKIKEWDDIVQKIQKDDNNQQANQQQANLEDERYRIENNILFYSESGNDCYDDLIGAAAGAGLEEDENLPGNDNEDVISKYLASKLSKEMSPKAAKIFTAAILGNMQHESGFNPYNMNRQDCDYTGTVCYASYGLSQWRGGRFQALMKSAGMFEEWNRNNNFGSNGWQDADVPKVSINKQLDYLIKELTTSYKSSVFDKIVEIAESSDSLTVKVEKATVVYGSNFEVFAGADDPNNSSRINRIKHAQKMLGKIVVGDVCNLVGGAINSIFDGDEVIIRYNDSAATINKIFQEGKYAVFRQVDDAWAKKDSSCGWSIDSACTEMAARIIAMNLLGRDTRPYSKYSSGLDINNFKYNTGCDTDRAFSEMSNEIEQDKDRSDELKTVSQSTNYVKDVLNSGGLVYYYARSRTGSTEPFRKNHAISIRGFKNNKFLVGDPGDYSNQKSPDYSPNELFSEACWGYEDGSLNCKIRGTSVYGVWRKGEKPKQWKYDK